MSLTNISSADRQSQNQMLESDIYDDGYLRVEHKNYYVSCAGQSLRLPRTEFLIFSRLARSPERIVPVEELWEYAWGREKPLNTESLHVYIYRLRHKLIPYSLTIETMVNVGYRLLLNTSAKSHMNGNPAAKT
jgi:two-component system, OmpR family, alkaline phosphatase synthesis response regulator PhoP